MAGNVEPVPQVESMRGESLHTGIQVQLLAPMLAGVRREPGDHPRARTARPVTLRRHEIVDVQVPAPRELRSDDEPGDASNLAIDFEIRDSVSGLLLLTDL